MVTLAFKWICAIIEGEEQTGSSEWRNERAKEMTDTENWQDTENTTANADEWQEVEAEAKIILEAEGEGFIGRYMGMDPANDNGIIQAHFTNVTYLTGEDIAPAAFINATRDLEQKLRKVPVKAMVRAYWESSLDTGHISGTKMRVFRVQWK